MTSEAPDADGRGSLPPFVRHLPLALLGIGVVWLDVPAVAVAWAAASRLAYVLFVALSLRAEDRTRALSRRDGAETAWRRFRTRASWLMDNDALAFGALCIATAFTLPRLPVPGWALSTAAVVLIAVGVGVKTWAARTLSEGAYHWRSFFVPAEHTLTRAGPYRWLSDPMYTVGYAHAYGFALLLRSAPGLLMAAFAQAMILLLHAAVERPHVQRAK